ncbi:Uncharacterised protein [Mycolicibacterium fortuitum]|uniref:Uncharacterized protein n=1 Tax=Mycolicibacterium fortuitum TaxID=1766 RepID=A0A378WF47_MYCFO|nr:Uncharacterised protein [Mycolicibacterium fortuitum]
MSSSEGGFYGLREWWSLTSRGGRVFVIGVLVVIGALVVWALVPSAEEKQIDDCAKRMAAYSYNDNETREETLQDSRNFCGTMWELSQ